MRGYLTLRGKHTRGELISEKTFAKAGEQFLREFEADTAGERNPKCLANHANHLRLHLVPFLGKLGLSEITTTKIQEYRIARMQSTYRGKSPAAGTLQKEIVTLRMTLKAAVRHGWLDHMPDLSAPYRSSTKVSHRAWFSPEEYKKLYGATRANIKDMTNGYHRHLAEQLHDKVLFMANTGIRPDEANWLEYRDVEIVEDQIWVPKEKKKLTNDYFHRRAYVDARIALRRWLQRSGAQLDFMTHYYQGDPTRAKLHGKPTPINYVAWDQHQRRRINPDGLLGLTMGGVSRLFVLELHNESDTGLVVDQLYRNFAAANAILAKFPHYETGSNPFVLSVHTRPEVLTASKSRVRSDPNFTDVLPGLVFSHLDDLKADFSKAWHYADGRAVEMFDLAL